MSEIEGRRPEAFAAPGRFFRGNLHTHSTLSDGLQPPEEVCRRYRDAGYDFLALTDHLIGRFGYPIANTVPFRTNAFTTLLGAEMHTGRMANGELWHLVAVGLPADFTPPNAPDFAPVEGSESAAEIARRAAEAGAFVAIAHPQWSGLTLADALEIDAAHAVEVYNHSCWLDSDRPDGAAMLDLLLSEGRRLNACATDDAHFNGPDAFGGWVMVKAETLAPEALIEALRAGRYYSSQGPEILDLAYDADSLTLVSRDVDRLVVVGQGSASTVVFQEGFTRDAEGRIVARAALGRLAKSPWIRAIAIDARGRRAWSNPIWR